LSFVRRRISRSHFRNSWGQRVRLVLKAHPAQVEQPVLKVIPEAQLVRAVHLVRAVRKVRPECKAQLAQLGQAALWGQPVRSERLDRLALA